MYFLESLSAFYREAVINRFLMTIVAWIIWPGLMFFVGVVFESREVPLWKHQSKAFFPGDLSLSIMLVALIGMYAKTGVRGVAMVDSLYWWLIVIITMAIVAWILRKNDVANYPTRRAVCSPTKMTHDVMGYFIIPMLLAGLGMPQLVEMIIGDGVLDVTKNCWLAFTFAVAFFLTCVAVDFVNQPDTVDMNARHPSDWRPIWRNGNKKR